MKKIILFLLILVSFNSLKGFSIEETLEEPILLEENNEKPVLLEEDDIKERYNPYSKKALRGIIEKEYDNKSKKGLFKDQLRHDFKSGFIEDVNFQFDLQHNVRQEISDESNFKYNMQLINVNMNGKFKGGKEKYCFTFDLTPQDDRSFLQQFVLDAWIETNRIPHHKLMFGTSRLNVGYEGGSSSYDLPFINRSQTARTLGNARKTGVRLKGNYKYLDYDLGGYSSDTWYHQFMPGIEGDFWVNFKPLAKFDNKYGELNLMGGTQVGERNSVDFFTTSTAIRYDYKKMWLMAEYQNSDGSNGGDGLTKKERMGYNLTLAYRLTKKAELLFRFDEFDYDKNIKSNSKKEYTAGLNYYMLGQGLRFIFNYVFCQNDRTQDSHRLIFGTQILL